MSYGTIDGSKLKWTHEISPNLQSRKQADDSTPEMIHFLTGYGSFAAKLVQMKLKDK